MISRKIPGLVKSHQKNGRHYRTRESEVGKKIAATTIYQVGHC
jgi:hypothetical protein